MKVLNKIKKIIVAIIIATFIFITTTLAQGSETNLNQNQALMFPNESYLCNSYLKELDKQGRLMIMVNQDRDYVYLKDIVNSLIYYNREATVECQSEQVQDYLKQSRQVLIKLKDNLSKVK